MIAIPEVDENTDLDELRQTLRGAAIEAGLSVAYLTAAEGVMICDGDIPAAPMITDRGFRHLLLSPPKLGTPKVLRARLVVKFAIKAATESAAKGA